MNNAAEQQMHVDDIMKRLQRTDPAKYSSKSFNKDNLLDVLNYYKKLSVIYVDTDDNVLFL